MVINPPVLPVRIEEVIPFSGVFVKTINSKSEYRNSKQIRNSNGGMLQTCKWSCFCVANGLVRPFGHLNFCHLVFFRISCFHIRIFVWWATMRSPFRGLHHATSSTGGFWFSWKSLIALFRPDPGGSKIQCLTLLPLWWLAWFNGLWR